MSLPTPTTSQLSDQIIGQLQGSLEQSNPLLPKAFLRVLAWVLAGAIVIVWKYAGFIFLQLFAAHASAEETVINGKKIRPLIELGRLLGVGDPLPAQRAQHMIAVTVTNQTGSLKAGQKLLRGPTRVLYETVAEVALNAPTVQVKIRAIGDDTGGDGSGEIGNLAVGDVVSFANTPANVATDATVVSTVVPGVNAEAVERYRARVIERRRRPPQGGAYADYSIWAKEVPGIANVYPYAGEIEGGSGPGRVDIYVQATPESSGDPDGIPTTDQKTAVFNNINLNVSGKATRRPVSAMINVLPITLVTFDFEIQGLRPDTPATREDIEDSIKEHLGTREPYIEGLSALPRDDRVTTSGIGGIVDAAAAANGATVAAVVMRIGGQPVAAYTLEHGEKARFGIDNYV